MGDKTGIQWTDATWNPIVGCSIVSAACTNCYAMAQAARIQKMTPGSHYEGTTREVNGKPVWTGVLKQAPEHILTAPLRWKRPRRIFVNSMSDLFHEAVPEEWIDRIFAIMALCPQHTFQVLTKRSPRMREYCCDPRTKRRVAEIVCDIAIDYEIGVILIAPEVDPALAPPGPRVFLEEWPLRNVWNGVTAERQEEADARIPDLLATPAAARFVSIEPMLGPVNLERLGTLASIRTTFPEVVAYHEADMRPNLISGMQIDALNGARQACIFYQTPDHMGGFAWRFPRPFPRLDWVICGGESGPDARPMHPDWARGLRDQCAAAGVPFFFKQWGEWGPPTDDLNRLDWPYHKDYDRTHWFDERTCARPIEDGWLDKYHGGGGALDPGVNLWQTPEYLDQVARCPQESCRIAGKCNGNEKRAAVTWVGKRQAGRLLDGREHNEFPEARK